MKALVAPHFLLDFSDRVREIAAPRAVMTAAAELLGRHLGAMRVGYSEMEEDGVHLRIEEDWRAEGVDSVAGRHDLESYGPEIAAAYWSGQLVAIDDFDADARTAGKPAAEAHRAIGVRGQLAVPLVKAGQLIALLFVHSAEPRRWSEQDIALVREVAERTWAAVERARAEEALRISESKFRTALEIGTVGAIYFDMDGLLTDANDAFLRMGGYSREDLESGRLTWQRLTPAEWMQDSERAFAELKEKGHTTPYGKEYIRKDGSRWWALFAAKLLPDGTGFEFVLDITDRKRTEEHLRDTTRQLNAVLENASVAIFVMNERQHCIYMNPAAEALTGYTLAETQGRPLHDVVHHSYPDGRPFPIEECAIDRAFPENNKEQGEEVFVHKDGSFYPIAFTASPIRDEDAKTVGTIIEVRDISGEKAAKERQALLIGELHHRVKNTLTTVQSVMSFTLRTSDSMEAFHQGMTGRLSSLARSHTLLTDNEWEGADLQKIVRAELEPYDDGKRLTLDGATFHLPVNFAVPFAMAVHELTTNAVKYGALSVPNGRLTVGWTTEWTEGGTRLHLEWTERNGPPVKPPTRRGFGSTLLERVLAGQLGGTVDVNYPPEGARVRIQVVISQA
ncbi:MAG: PAS domain S-box protein [Alphaproteobacteria bacterium]|nr:PAS domain S-box protein [Alphaproteobacteria bacterium]MBU0793238.1 PAS domain S-box protein [Alphaproteobacteria bacterium]MBU0874591.1 PAS domain S-box protein [Alphaproteobacteria bacterium]MBU1769808.1 PAS domain S-box protein [Alphaproteobacteria bacterium]